MDSGLDEDEVVLEGHITWVTFKVLSHLDGSLDQEVEVFWDLWSDTVGSEDAGDTGTSVVVDEADGITISEGGADSGWHHTLLGEGDDDVDDLLRSLLLPGSWSADVWERRTGFTMTFRVSSCHSKERSGNISVPHFYAQILHHPK